MVLPVVEVLELDDVLPVLAPPPPEQPPAITANDAQIPMGRNEAFIG
jgi:hypothetical protein